MGGFPSLPPAGPLFLTPELLSLPASANIMKSQTHFHSLMIKPVRNNYKRPDQMLVVLNKRGAYGGGRSLGHCATRYSFKCFRQPNMCTDFSGLTGALLSL